VARCLARPERFELPLSLVLAAGPKAARAFLTTANSGLMSDRESPFARRRNSTRAFSKPSASCCLVSCFGHHDPLSGENRGTDTPLELPHTQASRSQRRATPARRDTKLRREPALERVRVLVRYLRGLHAKFQPR
jgi:hypothetical protein